MNPIPDDYEEERRSSAEQARRFAAAVTGAIEGFVDAWERDRVAEEAKTSIHEAGELYRAVAEESRAQAQTPELQKVGELAGKAGHATADATRRATTSVRDTTTHAYGTVKERTASAANSVRETGHEAADRVRERVEHAKETAHRVTEDVKIKGEAVAESGRRARVAPANIRTELRAGARAWMKGFGVSLAMFALIGLVALTTFIVLTIGLVVLFSALVNPLAGPFLVVLLYLVVIGIAFAVARSARKKARQETRTHIENSKEEARNVTRPVREAFGRGRPGT